MKSLHPQQSQMRANAPHNATQPLRANIGPESNLANLQNVVNAGPAAQRLQMLQRKVNAIHPPPVQRMDDDEDLLQGKAIPAQETGGGLPAPLRTGIENLSGMSMGGVQVHRNSAAPAQVGAHAYAQGSDIHLAPGQERHLPHEAWHVVQQAQGRVRPTMAVAGTPVNDDTGLEREADVMGARAISTGSSVQLAANRRIRQHRTLQSKARSALKASGSKSAYPLPAQRTRPPQVRQDQSARTTAAPDVTYSVKSNAEYANWQGSVQCKLNPHGASTFGAQTVVVQYSRPASVLQAAGWWDKTKAALVIGEGVLTLLAAGAALLLSGGITAIPAFIGVGIGIVKIIRGFLMLKEEPPKAVIDAMRFFEAIGSVVGGALAGNPALIVFGVAKVIRSLSQGLTDWLGEETEWTTTRNVLLALTTLAHATEVVALGIAGVASIEAGANAAEGGLSGILGGAALGAVALSKGVRTADQGVTAVKGIKNQVSANSDAKETDPLLNV